MKPILEVVIPTYNRIENLKILVNSLLPHLNPDFSLLIIDNASTDGTDQYYNLLDNPYLRIFRNKVNLGGVVNMLRCIEFAESEFCWLVGDDDLINIEHMNVLIDKLKKHSNDVDVFHIPSTLKKLQEADNPCLIFNAEVDFLEKFYSLCEFQVMANNIYRVNVAQKYLRQAFQFCHLQHAYTVLTYNLMTKEKGLEILPLDLFKEPVVFQEKRWTKLPAVIDAMETIFLLVNDKKKCIEKESCERILTILRLVCDGFLGKDNIGLTIVDMKRLTSMLSWPKKIIPLVIIISIFFTRYKIGRIVLSFLLVSICFFKYKTCDSNIIFSKLKLPYKKGPLIKSVYKSMSLFNNNREYLFKN